MTILRDTLRSSQCSKRTAACLGTRLAAGPWLHGSAKFQRKVATTARSAGLPSKLRVNGPRLWDRIHHSCQWGQGQRWGQPSEQSGMSRLALTDADQSVRAWFEETTSALGCHVTIDTMGNMFAVRPGRRKGPPTCAGSHLDTQPTGGRYDGVLGVCAGIEMLHVLHEHKIQTEFPVGVINWTNEEGARFPISMVSSGVWAGKIPLEKGHALREVGGGKRSMKEDLQRIGYLGDMECSYEAMPLAAHFELHIEQGPRLEAQNQQIGVVEGVQAYRWSTITVRGRDCHTGTTDFSNRSDALLTAAKMILHSHRLAAERDALASTGILKLEPGSTNTVPGWVQFSLDIRSKHDEVVIQLENQLKADFARIAANQQINGDDEAGITGKGCEVNWTLDAPSEAVKFDPVCIDCVKGSASDLVGTGRVEVMTSGAGHDSVFTSKRVPTSMIFVPCRDGVSHNPREYCSPEDCENGAQVLLGAVVRYDAYRADKHRQT